jgi:hypothetical protein
MSFPPLNVTWNAAEEAQVPWDTYGVCLLYPGRLLRRVGEWKPRKRKPSPPEAQGPQAGACLTRHGRQETRPRLAWPMRW